MLYGVDSAYAGNPNTLVTLGYHFAAGYVGGRALNVWSVDDWRSHAAAGLDLLPIWVAPTGAPSRNAGVTEGNHALEAMQAVPLSGVIALDVENGAQPVDYTQGFVSACHAGELSVVLYGSRTSLESCGGSVDGWWLAQWVSSGRALDRAPLDFSMWQYATGPVFDYDVAVDDFRFATFSQV